MRLDKLKRQKRGRPWATLMNRLPILDRYIATELCLPFLFGMGLFTSLGIAVGTLFDLVRRVTESGLPFSIALHILLLKMPGFIVLAFPMSMLLASLMAFSRLSSDSELIALRGAGISVYRIVLPSVILSLMVTGMTFLVNDFVAPAANYQATLTMDRALDRVKPTFKANNIIYPEYIDVVAEDGTTHNVLARIFYAEEFDGNLMKKITILDFTQAGVNQILTANLGSWNVRDNVWDFLEGTIYVIAPDGSYRNIVRFQHQQLALEKAPLDLARRGRDYGEMNIFQAQEYLKALQVSGNEKKIRKLKVRIQEKLSLPFVCLIFGLLGAALGLKPQNTNRATSFGICIGLIFAYYLFSFLTSSMGISGLLTPFWAAWLPNTLGLLIGGWLLTQSAH